MIEAENPRHLSESVDHYTPSRIVEAARATMGRIDLDPFSSAEANKIVQATVFYDGSPGRNAWQKRWAGNVFINPPGGAVDDAGNRIEPDCSATGDCGLPPGHYHVGRHSAQRRAWFKLAAEYTSGRVHRAVFVCFSLELLQTTQSGDPILFRQTPSDEPVILPIPLEFPICYPRRRVEYVRPGGAVGKSPPHSSCIVYLTSRGDTSRFEQEFSRFGRIVVPSSRR